MNIKNNSLFNFDLHRDEVKKIDSVENKINYWLKKKSEFLSQHLKYLNDTPNFDECVDAEVEYLRSLLSSEQNALINEIQSFNNKNYWNTCQSLYNSDKVSYNTWEKVYNFVTTRMNELGLDKKYSSFQSFKNAKNATDHMNNTKK
ncbi:hypothetical protein A8B79_02465 [Balneola sp. EhC07]|uniref:hypothetical protein n=1 Tax=Balneola sp. EhC07 TaxID=1849360 RepID=UPI0007F3FAC0|nr:hypothetical protein [Balneola sp. EhC07]OAN62434.1 hypothetical protein A8B79_02465 [Balneola sp. EhC07]